MAATGYVSSLGDTRKVSKSGDAMTGDLVLADSTPDTPTSAASKGYTDSASGTAASSAVAAHAGASDPHLDRQYADNKFATQTDFSALNGTVNSLAITVGSVDIFVNDCLTRVANIEQGTAYLAGGRFVGPVLVVASGLAAIRFHGMRGTPGAPTTGDWAAGDLVIDSAGAWHLCTATGTPGSWT
ncbi:hypothetical protein AB0F46_29575 [Streptomyces sp. NPDC026665]|uniref:hypothetical protein n=1 Tax=Streptomyces sp. NPDC026665 TaxID=3154798 RepID=UPI0033CE10F9